MTLVNPAATARAHVASSGPWSRCSATGTSGYAAIAVRRADHHSASEAYGWDPARVSTMTGLSVARAASSTAVAIARSATLKAPTP